MPTRDSTLGILLILSSLVLPAGGLLALDLERSGALLPTALGICFPAMFLPGMCFLGRGRGFAFSAGLCPWRWAAILNKNTDLPAVRELEGAESIPVVPLELAPHRPPVLEYPRAPKVVVPPNKKLPLRICNHAFRSGLGTIASIMSGACIGVVAFCRGRTTPMSARELAFSGTCITAAVLSVGLAILWTRRYFRTAMTVSARILRATTAPRHGIGSITVEYLLDDVPFTATLAFREAEANAFRPGELVDIIVNPAYSRRVIYDPKLSCRINRYGDAPREEAGQRLSRDPNVLAAKAKVRILGGIVVIVYALIHLAIMIDLHRNGGTRQVHGFFAFLYKLFGPTWSTVLLFGLGFGLVVWGALTLGSPTSQWANERRAEEAATEADDGSRRN